MEILYSWIRNIIVYIILLNIVMNLLGKSSYKKYIGVFTGMILVLIVVAPIIKVIKASNTLDYYFESNNLALNANDVSNEMIQMEGKQKETIYKQYKAKIANQISQIVEKQGLHTKSIDVEIYEDKKSDDFGKIKSIQVVASHTNKSKGKSSNSNIKKITIDKIVIKEEKSESNNSSENGANEVSSVEETMLKNSLADFYNISLDNINISIQE
ncbi:hypothetical protein bsdtb5_16910 [Anaeromicropila herbilytica]|uniref:Stage III sporulation protein AF n=2 Tax=Anaeromicropila herbilytica TaxID=2785025 RepID=A0A7R7ID03_9FIRM|nr:hypothetical protein bsdtb5_16910 [Anaeromicropila herbilytica]